MSAVNKQSLVYDREIVIGDEVLVTFQDGATLTGILKFYYPQDKIWVIDEALVGVHYVSDYNKITKLITPAQTNVEPTLDIGDSVEVRFAVGGQGTVSGTVTGIDERSAIVSVDDGTNEYILKDYNYIKKL